jgi:hypothetical protein
MGSVKGSRLVFLRRLSERLDDGCLMDGRSPEQLLAEVFAPRNRVSVRATPGSAPEFKTVKQIADTALLSEKLVPQARGPRCATGDRREAPGQAPHT